MIPKRLKRQIAERRHIHDFQKIWQHGYSTRGSGRGIGLASYKKILEHYDNAFSLTTVSDGYFVQELKIQE